MKTSLLGKGLLAIVAIAGLLLGMACTSAKSTLTPATPTATRTQATPTSTPLATPASTLQPTLQPTSTPSEALYLMLIKPAKEEVVNTSTIPVVGQTLPQAVLSVNGELLEVGPDGFFSTQLQLQPGPNLIEVVASDLAGNSQSRVVAVIYIP